MSFFPGSFCTPAPELSYAPLFRLLEDFDNYAREVQAPTPAPAPASCPASSCAAPNRRKRTRQPRPQPTFRPNFDVRETETAYELFGELPGLERENVNIEFTDPQTMVISGRIERNYSSVAPAPAEINDTPMSDAESTASSDEEFTPLEKPRRSSYQATVEDDPEEPAEPTPATSPASSPKVAPADHRPERKTREVVKSKAAQIPEPRVLLSERLVGEFQRAFTFPCCVDHDGVTATLNNGILRVEVPKAKPMMRKIAISF